MAKPDLGGVRIKLARAHHHIQDLKRILDPVTEAMNSPGNIYGEPDGGDPTKLVHRVREVPTIDTAWSAMVGDALHNMRSALDHLAWQLVNLDGGSPCEHTQFPIFDSRTNAKGNPREVTIQPQIRRQDIRAALDEVQPYQDVTPTETELSVISTLNNRDKHRLLLTMAGVLNTDDDAPSYTLDDGVPLPEIRINLSPLTDGAPVVWFDFQGTHAPPDFEPHISLAITLNEQPGHYLERQSVTSLLEGLLHSLTWSVINWHFVPLLPGERQIEYLVPPKHR